MMAADDDDDDDDDVDVDATPHSPPSIVMAFDRICFEIGDQDAILLNDEDSSASAKPPSAICYSEIQEYSKELAYQLRRRFRPDYVLVDCQGWPGAEAVATLACMRIGRPFVPVSALDQHRPGRMDAVVELLLEKGKASPVASSTAATGTSNHGCSMGRPAIVAVTVCRNDRDPILSVFQQAGVHQILFLDKSGMIQEQLQVPDSLPELAPSAIVDDLRRDDIYVLFTSGTSTSQPKAVIGSHRATYNRIQWFLNEFPSSPRIGRRTKLTFVDGVTELWGALLDPESLLVAVKQSKLQRRGVEALLDMGCTQLLLLPSQLGQLLLLTPPSPKPASSSSASLYPPWSLERVVVSGEVCTSSLVEKFRRRYPNKQLINLYGQTETTGDCLCAVLTDLGEAAVVDNVVAVGRPIAKTEISLVGGKGQDLECQLLRITGSQLSNGYLGGQRDDGDTSISSFGSFVPGDVGFCRNGIWYVRGRLDDIKKLNGVWTSPSEVEAAFCKTFGVVEAVAVILEDNNDAKKDQMYILCENQLAVQSFSRVTMHEAGIPWNLIPNQAFCRGIPRSASGAAKVDRQACVKIVQEANALSLRESTLKEKDGRCSTNSLFLSIASSVLGIEERHLDWDKSFVELGGDSATSITMLYHLKQESRFSASTVDATDILLSESLYELTDLMCCESKRKKRKLQDNTVAFSEKSVPTLAFVVNDRHRSIQMLACVDSSPLVIDNSIFTVCQGGAILKFDAGGKNEGSRHYPGWRFQAELLPQRDSNAVIVCGHSLAGHGLVLCLSADLNEELWRLEVQCGPITSRPVSHDGRLWVLAGSKVLCLNVLNGHKISSDIDLPRTCVTAPILLHNTDHITVAFASSDWEGGLMVLDPRKGTFSICADCEIGPVHKDMTSTKDCPLQLYITDVYGSLHCFNVDTLEVLSLRLSSSPLTSATALDTTNVVVGSYDGHLYGVRNESHHLKVLWKCDCMSVVYSNPIRLDDGSIVACTTAGDVLNVVPPSQELRGEPATFRSSYRIPAEIWSSPSQLQRGRSNVVVVGARDSKCHIMTLDSGLERSA